MAIPTDFKGYTPSAGTTKSYKLLGSATVGIWANDVDGSLAATTFRAELGPGAIILTSQAYTDAQLAELLKDMLARIGLFHEGAGGGRADGTRQILVPAQTTS